MGYEEQIDYPSKVHVVLDFKIFLQKFILSIDPNFDTTVIDAAYYRSKQANGEALVYLQSAEAAVEIETKLNNVKVRDMFPGNFLFENFPILVKISLYFMNLYSDIKTGI